jgi:hypothetical protein
MYRWLTLALALSACTEGPPPPDPSTCHAYVRRACRPGCGSTADCSAAWLEAAALDPDDALESCIGVCPRVACEADTFFACDCYLACLDAAAPELRDAVSAAIECDLGGVPASCP